MAQRRSNLFGGDDQGLRDDRAGGGVGALLKRRREELQQNIEEVSKQLRIRSVYVRAIEEGRFQELPGTAYAVGFVRAYADYLGLDGNSVVGDYRDELARRSRQNDLVWPSESSESRFPGGTILVVCVLLGLAIYGGWYYATQSSGTGISLIAQVPEYIKKATGVGQATDQGAPTNSVAGEANTDNAVPLSEPAPVAAAEPSTGVADSTNSTGIAVAPSNSPAAQPATGNAMPTAPTAPITPPAVVATPETDAPAAVALGQGSPVPSPAVTPPASTLVQPSEAAPAVTVSPSAPPPPAPPLPAAPQPVVTSVAQAAPAPLPPLPPAAKVVIRANRDSWIEIRDQNEDLVVQKVLRQGESFNVPDQKGLIMTTGNAGGIVIELLGKPMQSLGSLGVVKRGIKLDPAALADGSAFVNDDY